MELTQMWKRDWLRGVSAAGFATMLCACGASATPQLADARRAYDEAESSQATRARAPGALAEAKLALDRAETAQDDQPGSDRAVQLAERAARKARYAEARGEARADVRADAYTRNAPRTERVIVAPRDVADDRVHTHAHAHDHDYDRKVSVRERNRDSKEAAAALQSLAKVANVKQESRGVVITLSGSLLFPSGEERLSPIANDNLDQVAHALSQQPDDTTFHVDGYTDSSGSDDANRELSAKRAHAVADRLRQAGIESDRISVSGRGEADPIADNDSNEGRATNRRVEIVVEPHK